MQRLNHPDADYSKLPAGEDINRFRAARRTTLYILVHYTDNTVGDCFDFSSYGETYWRDFYLGNIMDYALQANDYIDTADVKKEFKGVNYTFK